MLRNILLAIALLISGAAFTAGWWIYRALPKPDGRNRSRVIAARHRGS